MPHRDRVADCLGGEIGRRLEAERIEAAGNELAYLRELRLHTAQAEGFAAIEALRQELEEHTGGRHDGNEKTEHRGSKKQSARKVHPLTDADGNLIVPEKATPAPKAKARSLKASK